MGLAELPAVARDTGGVSLASARRAGGRRRTDAPPGDGRWSVDGQDLTCLQAWLPLLRRLSISPQQAAPLAALARSNGSGFQVELLASGLVAEAAYFRALACEVGIGFAPCVDPDRLIVSEALALSLLRRASWHLPVKLEEGDGATTCLLSPESLDPQNLRRLVERYPRIRSRLKIVPPEVLRRALLARVGPLLVRHATRDLHERFPALSARVVANAWQGFVVGAALVALPAAAIIAPFEVWAALHFFFSFFFLACVGLRFAALQSPTGRPVGPAPCLLRRPLPVYSVLVALYDEAAVVPGLLAALGRLAWPADRLEIKLVCEDDDAATLAALAALDLPRHFEVVRVPAVGPRTKPKALAYALPLASGEFVALYDAEDSPDPLQLALTWQAFREAAPDVGCIQAPLEISNPGSGAIARMFAFEYASLFRALLPWLSARRLLLPLGGTSNHFRRSVLDEVGGWDPYNVTEDADLGMRLARFGYRTGIIACPTAEPAPEHFATWLPQRTRWFKGWMQTWLVHMRDPFRLAAELGPGSFLVAQILFAGMVLSALAHPFLVVTGLVMVVDLALARPMGPWRSLLLAVDLVNVACGYLSFLLLGWQALERRERRGFWRIVLFTPVYWMMMSLAAWRAVWQLCRRPHHWEKTPHEAAAGLPAASLEQPRPVADDLRVGLADDIHVAARIV